ncbi:MAG: carbohydrate kinase [SAR324 cluster bacterium]|nr:carbohydrate kinase [SAR324 cluster bacterium]
MTEKTHILAIDNGTQSLRALLFDLKGNIETKVQIQLEPYFSEHPGWAEQHAVYFWENLCKACQDLWNQTRVSKAAIAGVAVTTQRACVINLDKNGTPLRPMISWLDQRRTEGIKPIGGLMGLIFKLVHADAVVHNVQAESEANWIATHQPEIWEKTSKYVLLSGYHIYKLTGEFRDSVGAQVGYLPFDYKKLEWCSPKAWQWQIAPLKREMLPDLVPPGGELGTITAAAGKATGIPEGLPLIAASTDKGCEILGAGCLERDVGCLSFGTTATINTVSDKYIESSPLMPPWPAPVPGGYNIEEMIYRGYWMVDWFKKQFALREQQIADEQGIQPEKLFDDLVNAVPPGSMGLTLQPYWSPGRNNPEAKGAMIGFGDVHTRAHMYRAILEGLAYGLREGKERIEKKSGVTLTKLVVAGGGSQSDAAMQLTADIFGLPAARPHVYEASGLGAAIDAAVGLGLYPGFETAIQEMTRTERVFQPNPENHKIYNDLYHKVYLKMYKQLQPLYKEIRDITGYPAKN